MINGKRHQSFPKHWPASPVARYDCRIRHCKSWRATSTRLRRWRPIHLKKCTLSYSTIHIPFFDHFFIIRSEQNKAPRFNIYMVCVHFRTGFEKRSTYLCDFGAARGPTKGLGMGNGVIDRFLHIYWSKRWIRIFFAIFQVIFVTLFRFKKP